MMNKSIKTEVIPTYDNGDFVLARAQNSMPWPARISYFRGFHQGYSGMDEEIYHVKFMGGGDEQWGLLENHLITQLSLPRIQQLKSSDMFGWSTDRKQLKTQLKRVERMIKAEREKLGGKELEKFDMKYSLEDPIDEDFFGDFDLLNQKSVSFRRDLEERNKQLSQSIMMSHWGPPKLHFKRIEKTAEGITVRSFVDGIISDYVQPITEPIKPQIQSPALTADSPQNVRNTPLEQLQSFNLESPAIITEFQQETLLTDNTNISHQQMVLNFIKEKAGLWLETGDYKLWKEMESTRDFLLLPHVINPKFIQENYIQVIEMLHSMPSSHHPRRVIQLRQLLRGLLERWRNYLAQNIPNSLMIKDIVCCLQGS